MPGYTFVILCHSLLQQERLTVPEKNRQMAKFLPPQAPPPGSFAFRQPVTFLIRLLRFLPFQVSRSFFLHSSAFAQGFSDDPLQLTVSGTEFICRPLLDSRHRISVHPEYKAFRCFLFGHIPRLMIQCTRIDYRLGWFVSTEHHEQIAHHGCLLFFVQVHDFLFPQLVERHLHHRNRPFDDLFTR